MVETQPTIFAYVVLFTWIPVLLALFATLGPRRAVLVGSVAAWLFLPNLTVPVSGLPDLTKATTTSWGLLLGTFFFARGLLFARPPRWYDLPMIVWCLCPFASSLENGLGAYDGFSETLARTVEWGLPYVIGRAYFGDLPGLHELAVSIIIGGLIYVPFCLFELRMSPQIQMRIYGTSTGSGEVVFGGFRPFVFLRNGLELGMWMTTASLVGFWSWASGALPKLRNWPFGRLLAVLMGMTVLCRATGALGLLTGGIGMYFATKWTRSWLPAIVLILLPPTYMVVRATGLWSGQEALTIVRTVISERRAESLQTRMNNEDQLSARALEKPIFGWGGWGRARIYDEEEEKDVSITDGMWVIALGTNGLVGLVSYTVSLLLPLLLLINRFNVRLWREPWLAPASALAILLTLFMLDSLANAFVTPMYIMAMGGLNVFLGNVDRREMQRLVH
jgi:hypothetical protein